MRGGYCAIYIDTVKIAHSTNASFEMSMSTRDTTSKDVSGYETRAEGLLTWSMSGDFYFAEDAAAGAGFEDLWDDMHARTSVTALYSNANTGDVEYSGTGWITSLSRSGGIDSDNESFSVSLEGTGAIAKATIA